MSETQETYGYYFWELPLEQHFARLHITAIAAINAYNCAALKRLFSVLILLAAAIAQNAPTSGQTILAVPFENQSKAPALEWIPESVPPAPPGSAGSPA